MINPLNLVPRVFLPCMVRENEPGCEATCHMCHMCHVLVVQVKLIEQEYLIRQEVCREFGEQLIEIEERHRLRGKGGRAVTIALTSDVLCCYHWVHYFTKRKELPCSNLYAICTEQQSLSPSPPPPSIQSGAGGAGC